MPSDGVPSGSDPLNAADRAQPSGSVETLLLHAEEAVVSKRVHQTQVRVVRTTGTRDETVEIDLNHEHVVVDRVAIGRVVDAVPEVRQEADVTILPIMEEEVVVTRRLVLKEELHIRRVRTTEHHVETVTLRRQDAVVTRTKIED